MYIKDTKIVLDLHFAPSIYWFALFINNEIQIQIEAHGNFKKSGYMNRCQIAGVNGLINISLPIQGGRIQKVRYDEVIIDWNTKHNTENLHSLQSAYNSAPYFEYYWDELLAILQSGEKSLWHFNLKIVRFLIKEIGIDKELAFTSEFYKAESGLADFRSILKPSNREELWPLQGSAYIQVFHEKNPFLKGLSVLDLLFNLGPETKQWLENFSEHLINPGL